MRDPLQSLAREGARRNPFALVVLTFGTANLIAAGGVGLLAVYQPLRSRDALLLVAISQALVSIDHIAAYANVRRLWRPVRRWLEGDHGEPAVIAAWTALASLPTLYTRRVIRYPSVVTIVPLCIFITWLLKLSYYDVPVLVLGALVVVACAGIVRFSALELAVRPLLERVAEELPSDFQFRAPAIPLRLRLLAMAPVINVITAVVVAGLSNSGKHLADLGVAVLVAVGISFTISLELVLLVSRSLLAAFADLREVTARVAAGDYQARMLIVSADEVGALAQSFNRMVEGLDERERLREAFGAYVDPTVADRVLQEGADLEAEEVEVTILFLDIRDFTSFSERVRARELVTFLSGFWELVVPVLLDHGGHANKFIGDGLLGVFGAPDRHPDHALRAVEAALAVCERVEQRYRGRIAIGIGVNSGRVVAGTVGGGGRVEFTVIGDTVNTAARVEEATRETGDVVLVTESTRELLPAERFTFAERPPVRLRGKRDEVRLFAVREHGPSTTTARRSAAAAG